MSEQVRMVKVKTDPNDPSKLYYVCKISNMVVSNHSRLYEVSSESKNHSSFRFL